MKKLKILIALVIPLSIMACEKEQNGCVENPPKTNVSCTQQYDPVCGCNNKTYGNACEAEAMGITNYTKGACKN